MAGDSSDISGMSDSKIQLVLLIINLVLTCVTTVMSSTKFNLKCCCGECNVKPSSAVPTPVKSTEKEPGPTMGVIEGVAAAVAAASVPETSGTRSPMVPQIVVSSCAPSPVMPQTQ